MSGARRDDATPARRGGRGQWVYVAVGGAIVDRAGSVRKILHLSPKVDDLTIERTKPLLRQVDCKLVTVAPATLCETGRQINGAIDETIARWREKHAAKYRQKSRKRS